MHTVLRNVSVPMTQMILHVTTCSSPQLKMAQTLDPSKKKVHMTLKRHRK